MPFNAGSIYAKMVLDTKGFKSGADGVKREAESLRAKLSSITSGLRNLGLGLGAFGSATLYALKKLTDEASQEELAFAKLGQAVTNAGYDFAKVRPTIEAFAAEMQRTTVYGDDMTASLIQRMIPYTNNLKSSMEGVTLAMDMAASGMFDIETATRYVGMAMSGNVEILARYIPELRETTNETLKNMSASEKGAYALELLRQKFGGMAQKELSTFSGQVKQMSNYIGDMKESLGMAVIQGLNPYVEKVRNAAYHIKQWVDNNKELTAQIMKATLIAGGLATAIGTITAGIWAFNIALGVIVPAVKGFYAAILLLNPEVAVLLAGIVAIAAASMIWEEEFDSMKKSINSWAEEVKQKIKEVDKALMDTDVLYRFLKEGARRTALGVEHAIAAPARFAGALSGGGIKSAGAEVANVWGDFFKIIGLGQDANKKAYQPFVITPEERAGMSERKGTLDELIAKAMELKEKIISAFTTPPPANVVDKDSVDNGQSAGAGGVGGAGATGTPLISRIIEFATQLKQAESEIAQFVHDKYIESLQYKFDLYSQTEGYAQQAYDTERALIVAQAEDFARMTGDVVAAAQWMKQQIENAWVESARAGSNFISGMKAGLIDLRKNLQQFGEQGYQSIRGFAQNVESSMSNMFEGILNGTASFKDAWKKFILDIGNAFIKMVSEMIAKWIMLQIVMGIAKIGLGVATGGASVAVEAGAGAAAGAAGSYQTGTDFVPQTSLYMLHRGEAVVPANENTGAGKGKSGEMPVNIINVISDEMFARRMASKMGRNTIVNVIDDDSRRAGATRRVVQRG